MTSFPVAATETQSSRKQETSSCLKFHVSQFGAERRHDGFIFLSGETAGSCWIIKVGMSRPQKQPFSDQSRCSDGRKLEQETETRVTSVTSLNSYHYGDEDEDDEDERRVSAPSLLPGVATDPSQ